MWQATQKLYQKDAPAENCPSQKRKYLWPGQFPASVSPAMAMQAQIARRKERRLGLPLFGSMYIHPGVNVSKSDASPVIKTLKIVFLAEENLH